MGINAAAHLGLALTVEHAVIDGAAIGHSAESGVHLRDQLTVGDLASRRHGDPARLVTRFEKLEEIVALKTIDRRFPAANRPGDGMILEEIDAEKIVDVVVRSIFGLRNFLQNHRALALYLIGI